MRKKSNEKTSVPAWDFGKALRIKEAICDHVLNGFDHDFSGCAISDPVNFSGGVAMFRDEHLQSMILSAKKSNKREKVMGAKRAIKRLLGLMLVEESAWKKNKMMESARISARSRNILAGVLKK